MYVICKRAAHPGSGLKRAAPTYTHTSYVCNISSYITLALAKQIIMRLGPSLQEPKCGRGNMHAWSYRGANIAVVCTCVGAALPPNIVTCMCY